MLLFESLQDIIKTPTCIYHRQLSALIL